MDRGLGRWLGAAGDYPQHLRPDRPDLHHAYANGGTTFDVAITAVTDQGLVVGDELVPVQAPADDPNYPTNPPGTVNPPDNGSDGGGGNGSNSWYAGGTFRIQWCGYYPLIPISIDWGDGGSSSSSNSDPSHTYSNPGQYHVVVTDSSGTIVGGNWVNVIPNYHPILTTVPDQIVSTGDAIDVSTNASDMSPNGVYEGYVDWGDGTGLHPTDFTDSGTSATLSAHLDDAGDPGQHSVSLNIYSANEPYNHSGLGNSAGFNLDVAGSPLLIDANNDDGLDVPTLDNTPESEQQTFSDTTQPGKLVSVNTGDKDGDGIPDFADGYNLFTDQSDSASPPTSDQGAGFVPITVQIPSWVDPTKVQLTFTYSASDPNLVTRTGSGTDDDPYVYTPADGNLRLWLKDEDSQRNPASVGDGGDWIKPDESFPASDLDGTTIYVEAVRPSTDLADDTITLTLTGSHLPPDPTGTVHLTAFGMQYDQVNSDGTISPATQPQVSQPSPIIDLTAFDLTNVHFSSDYTQIIADINLMGTVTDAASDLIPGADGTINTIDVTLNGSNSSLGTLNLEVTKSTGTNSLMHPYAFSGSFDQTLTNVVVNPGWNLIHLSAANIYGYSGYAEASMEVDVNPDNTDITLSQDPYTADADAQIAITYTRDGQATTDTLKRDQNEPELWINNADTITVDTSNAGGGNETLHVTDTTREIDDDVNFVRDANGVMHGTFVPDPDTQSDYRNMSVTTGGETGVTASTGGTLNGFLLEVVGPTQLENLLHQVTINDLDFKIISYDDKNFLQPWESNLTIPGVDLAMIDTSPSTNPVLLSLSHQRRDGLANFGKGFGAGVMDAGVSLWDGAKSMGKAVWNAMPPVIIYHLFNGQIVKQVRQGIQNLKVAAGVAEVLYQAVKQNSQQVIIDMMLGNNTTINALGEQYTKAFEAVGELLQQVGNWFDNLDIDDYTFGKIEGRIVGEALVLLLTEGAGQIAELSKAALLQKLLPRLIKIDDLAPVAAKVTEATEEIIQYSNTAKMCFVAGTLVHTDNGLKPIEALKVGDQVFSKNEATGERAYKQVVQTIVTHPTSLYHVHYANEIGSREILICTGEHPFYVKTRAGFVPAKDLMASDLLVTAEGQTAEVQGVVIEDAFGGSFTTYNLEVADFHTYFVGQAGVWVHNAGGGLCQEVAAAYREIRQAQKLDPWPAFVQLLQRSPAKINAALGDTVAEVMGDCYKLAAKTGDYSKVPSVKQVKDVMTGRLGESFLETHHTVPKYVQELLGLNPAIVDDCPALILTDGIHQNYPGSFHSILEKLIPENTRTMSRSDILKNLKQAYMDFGAPNAWAVVQNWLSKV